MATTLTQGADIINQSLRDLGYDYQIDTTSNVTITAGLEAIGAYPPAQLNALMNQMNLVVQQRNFGVMFDASKNEFRNFLVDMMTTGFGIEDVFHEILAGTRTLWDGNANAEEIARDLVEYKSGQIDKFFHVEGDSAKFDTTIDTRNYEKVFTPYGVTRYIDTRLANLSWSAEYWLMQKAIEVAKSMVADNNIVLSAGHNINNKTGIDDTVETFISLVDGFKTPSMLYNKGAYKVNPVGGAQYTPVINMTNDESEVFIITTPELMARLKVHGYSNAFNLSQYELKGRILFAPAGTDLGRASNGEQVLAMVVDRRAILLGLKRWLGTTFYVANTGWTNHFLNVEILKGYNTIFNAVAITGEDVDDFFGDALSARGATIIAGDIQFETDGTQVAEFRDDSDALLKYMYENASYVKFNGQDEFTLTLNGTQIVPSGISPTYSELNDKIFLNIGDILVIDEA